MLNGEDKKMLKLQKFKNIFPAQNTTGTHINISGGGVTKYAKNKENAIKLLEFLSSVEVQEILLKQIMSIQQTQRLKFLQLFHHGYI